MSRSQSLPDLINRRGRQLRHARLNTLASAILALLIMVPSPVSISMSVGGILSLILAPVTFPTLWRDTRGRWFLFAVLALVPSGWLVAQNSLLQDRGRSLSNQVFLYEAALPVGLLGGVIGAYWSITILGFHRFLLLSLAGSLAAVPLSSGSFHSNPWKYGLALPISILAILLVARNRVLLVLVVLLLAGVSVRADLRLWIALLAIVTLVTVFAGNRWTRPPGSGVVSLGLVTVAASMTALWLITQAATSGMLGTSMQERTRQQLEGANGNLLLGGRPEWGAAIALWQENPFGIGIGVAPSLNDYWIAIGNMPFSNRGLQEISTVAISFKRGQINFHSTFWNFWGFYGAAGVILVVLALIYLAHATMATIAATKSISLKASLTLLLLSGIWNILFSPTDVSQLVIALATALYTLHQRGEKEPDFVLA